MIRKTPPLLAIFILVLALPAVPAVQPDTLSLTPYGYLKFDAVYETGFSSNGNYTFWAREPVNDSGLFHLTANQTRVGLKIKTPGFGKFAVTGQVEVDFYGGGQENTALNFMRHAYIRISNGSLTVIAGQYWDLIGPLNPMTLNYPVLWGAGNIGYRRPQLRIRKDFSIRKTRLRLEGGFFRTIAGDLDGDGVDDGTAGGFPTLQGRIAGRFPWGEEASLQLGVSGHYGETRGRISYKTSSYNADLSFRIADHFQMQAEIFKGRNLGSYLGGILQSVNPLYAREIRARGFFIAVKAALSPSVTLHIGYGSDDPENEDLSPGDRSRNICYYGNIQTRLGPHLTLGLELSNWITDYLEADPQNTFRIHHAWILHF